MISFLHQPFPYPDNFRRRLLMAAGISVFVFFLFVVFKPFGMNNIAENHILIAAGYGAVTFIIAFLTNIIVPKILPGVFNERKWTVLREIIYIQFLIFLVATGNLLFTGWLGYHMMGWEELMRFELIAWAVSAILVISLIITKQLFLARRNLKSAKNISDNLYHKERLMSKNGVMVTIVAENSKDNFLVEARSIHYVAAADGYVEVFYYKNNIVEKKMLRNSLRNVQGNLKTYSQFYRCHRAYIVNLEKVVKVTGNAQGYRLILENVQDQIPVSRSMNQEITLRLVR